MNPVVAHVLIAMKELTTHDAAEAVYLFKLCSGTEKWQASNHSKLIGYHMCDKDTGVHPGVKQCLLAWYKLNEDGTNVMSA